MKSTAAYWIDKLQLTPHPEGGYYRETYRSGEWIQYPQKRYAGQRCFSTAIYFLLESNQYSAFHRIKSDEIWHFYNGCPLEIFVLNESEGFERILLGNDDSEIPIWQYTITRGKWFAAKPILPESYSLIGCTVAPGFEFSDFELAEYNILSDIFPEHTELLKKFCAHK